MAPVWQNAQAFGNCRIKNRWINSDFDHMICLDKVGHQEILVFLRTL